MYSLFVILSLLIFPSILTNRLEGDAAWQVNIVSMYIVILVQSIYIYRTIPRIKGFKHLVAFIILMTSIWFLFDYLAVSYLWW